MGCLGILVGVDGSPASNVALRWAAAEAVRRGRELVVVHAFDGGVVGAPTPFGGSYAAGVRELAEKLVVAAVADARTHAPRRCGEERRGRAGCSRCDARGRLGGRGARSGR